MKKDENLENNDKPEEESTDNKDREKKKMPLAPDTVEMALKLKRRQKIELFILKGKLSKTEIGNALDITPSVVNQEIKKIRKQWREEHGVSKNKVRDHRLSQCSLAASLAIESFYLSRMDDTETTTTYTPQMCKACKGKMVLVKEDKDGGSEEVECNFCQGTGFINKEVTTTKVRGRSGDPALLNAYMACVKEMAKIDGVHRINTNKPEAPGKLAVAYDPVVEKEAYLRGAANESLIQLREIIEGLEKESKDRVIDVKVLEEDEDKNKQ